jgi:hypothetical protein
MLWRKIWWDTRWFFLLTLGVTIPVCVLVLGLAGNAAQADHQRMVWVMWFRWVMTISWPLIALMMAITILRSFPFEGQQGASGLFTLSLPITRRKTILSHCAVIMMGMTLISLAHAPVISAISGFNGRWFPIMDAFLYSLFMGIGGMAFVSFSYLLIVILKNNTWAIIGPVMAANALLHWPQWVIEEYPWWNIFHVMSGESYFHHGEIPWIGLLVSFAVSVLIMFAAVRMYERRDF